MHVMGVRNLEYYKIKRNFDLAIRILNSKLTNFNILTVNAWLRILRICAKNFVTQLISTFWYFKEIHGSNSFYPNCRRIKKIQYVGKVLEVQINNFGFVIE